MSFAEVSIKRAILAVLGAVLVLPQAFWTYDLLAHPSKQNLITLLIQIGGAIVGPLLLPRWNRWPALASAHRFGAMFLSSYVLPIALWAAVVRYENGLVFPILLSAPLAFGITALWWTVAGYRLDHKLDQQAAT